MERAVRGALRRIGSRGEAQSPESAGEASGTCPVCGKAVTQDENSVRVWHGKYAHPECAHYPVRRRTRRSQRVHKRFTRS